MWKKSNDARLGVSASLSQCQPQRIWTSFLPTVFTKFLSLMTNIPLDMSCQVFETLYFSEAIPKLSLCHLMHLETNYSAEQEKYFPTVLPTSFPTSNKKSNLRISQLSVYSSSEVSFSTMPQFVCFFFFLAFHFFLHHSDRNLFTLVVFLSCNTNSCQLFQKHISL